MSMQCLFEPSIAPPRIDRLISAPRKQSIPSRRFSPSLGRRRFALPRASETMNCLRVEASLEDKKKDKEGKLWGGRFEESVTDAVERFSESVSFDKQLYKHDIMGSRAHASMLAQQGLMTISDRDTILKGLDEIEKKIEAGEFDWRADREDVHMNIEAALTDMIGEPAKKLHTARSRNDQVALVRLAVKNEGLIVPGYTHLQRAQPVLLQHLLLSYVEQLERDAGRFADCYVRLNFCPLGACALAGTGLPIDRFMTSSALGFTAPMRNRSEGA
ncbi:Argininosuccinate lyase [Acorus calamus]|uniref:Argininosuccinate lyase n=1 Tax=Acorus calamus TaxID=4465 RepID=A0AAV9CSV9_ACOCL|nr:Argininosuccinate lyase [Acorus calamus]